MSPRPEHKGRVHRHRGEAHPSGSPGSLNRLRAGVLGANDGIVSVAGLVVGVAGATTDRTTLATAAVAGVVAGAASMALGEYVSVSSQRDSEQVLLARERAELEADPEAELAELADLYVEKGLSPATAQQVATELTARDAFAARIGVELGFGPHDLVRPWQASITSAVSFVLGALLPVIAVLLPPVRLRVPLTFVVVLVALALTGAVSARIGGASRRRAVTRVVVGGALAMAVTFAVGRATSGLG